MSTGGAAQSAAVPVQQCPRRRQPKEQRGVTRAEDARRQGPLGAECPQTWPAVEKSEVVLQEMRPSSARSNRRWSRSCRRHAVLAPGRGRRVAPCDAERLEAEVLEFRSYEAGLALILDGNGTRSVETLLR